MSYSYEQILWCIAVPSGVIYFCLIIATFLGFGGDIDLDTDVDVDSDFDFDGLGSIFTFRNAVYFAFGYSGGALIGIDQGWSHTHSTLFGFILGIILVCITIAIMYLMHRLSDNNIPTNDGLVGKTARTYLRIQPGNPGKITVNLNGSTRELIATSDETISTGTIVIIEKIDNGVAHVVKQ